MVLLLLSQEDVTFEYKESENSVTSLSMSNVSNKRIAFKAKTIIIRNKFFINVTQYYKEVY